MMDNIFRSIKIKHKALAEEASIEILATGSTGVLSLIGDNGYPYGVPLNYVYRNHRIYLHGARRGHKIDCIGHESKACFTVIAQDEAVPEKFSTHYKSVIVFGKIRILQTEKEKKAAFMALVEHISSDFLKEGEEVVEEMWKGTAAMELVIEHMTGKVNQHDE